jgi:hypothetical protein
MYLQMTQFSYSLYNPNYCKETKLAAYLSTFCFFIKFLFQIFENKNQILYAYKIIYTILFISCLLTIYTCDQISLIFIFLVFVNIPEHHKLQFFIILIGIIYNILFSKYSYRKDYDVFKLIDLNDISEEVMPKILIAAAVFSLISILLDKFITNELHIALIKFTIFTLIVGYFISSISNGEILTIFPLYSYVSAFIIVIMTHIYLEITSSPTYTSANIETTNTSDIIGMSFYLRKTTKFISIPINNCKTTEDMIKILKIFQSLNIYVSTKSTENKEEDKKKMSSDVVFFPYITLENIEKSIQYINKKLDCNQHVLQDLQKLRDSYHKNWIKTTHDQFCKYFHKFYSLITSIERTGQIINISIVILSSISISILIAFIFKSIILGICILIFFVYMTYMSYLMEKFFKLKIKEPSEDKGDFKNPEMLQELQEMLKHKKN